MNLKDFFDYKNQFFHDVLTNETLVKLINETKTLETAEELSYTQLFPYEYIPETIEHGHTYICCDVDVAASSVRTNKDMQLYCRPVLYVWVLVHKSKLRLPDGGVRYDAICSEITETINGSLKYGYKPLQFSSVKRFTPLTDYQGKMLTFTAEEINCFYNPTRDVPENRKRDL